MKSNSIIKLSTYTAKSDDIFFFDNNIWMFLFCPLANYSKGRKQYEYSSFFKSLLSRKLHIYTNSLVLSEFANRYLKLDFEIVKKDPSQAGKYNNFKKDYVGSDRYKKTSKEVRKYLTQILTICQKSSDEFNSIDINNILNLFETIGFNDSYYAHLACNKNWKIVTDDTDFLRKDMPQIGLTILSESV